jgi:hypothetical protein
MDFSDGARKHFTLDHHDRTWGWLDRYYVHKDVFTDIVSRQQV